MPANGQSFERRIQLEKRDRFGEFEVVSEKAETDRVLNLFSREFPGFTLVEARLDAAEENRKSIVFRVNVSDLTGVKETS